MQAYDEPYVVGTDVKLLKWKYGNMNSVDFLLRSKAAGKLFKIDNACPPTEGIAYIFRRYNKAPLNHLPM